MNQNSHSNWLKDWGLAKVWAGNVQPLWKVIEERHRNGSDFSNVWDIIRAKMSPAL